MYLTGCLWISHLNRRMPSLFGSQAVNRYCPVVWKNQEAGGWPLRSSPAQHKTHLITMSDSFNILKLWYLLVPYFSWANTTSPLRDCVHEGSRVFTTGFKYQDECVGTECSCWFCALLSLLICSEMNPLFEGQLNKTWPVEGKNFGTNP